jgi:hypothetical protein
MFQFATVRHPLCGPYLSARFKRGKSLFRNGCIPHESISGRKSNLKKLGRPLNKNSIPLVLVGG